MIQQIEPYPTLWIWLKDGSLRSISYDKSQEVCAWCRQVLGGKQVKILQICCIPYIDENRDQVWFLVERFINGQKIRYLETLDAVFDDQIEQKDGYFVDCGGTFKKNLIIKNISVNIPVSSNQAVLSFTCEYSEDVVEYFVQNSVFKVFDIKAKDPMKKGFEILNGHRYTVDSATKVADKLIVQTHLQATEDLYNLANQTYDKDYQKGEICACVTMITEGISHLEGEEVYAIVDGAVSSLRKVINGRIQLDSPGAVVHVGLPYVTKYKSVRLDIALNQNDSIASKQRIHRLFAQIYRTSYFKYGFETTEEVVPARKYGIDKMDTAPALRTGLVEIPFEANWTRQPHIIIESDLPVPLCILRLTTQTSINL